MHSTRKLGKVWLARARSAEYRMSPQRGLRDKGGQEGGKKLKQDVTTAGAEIEKESQ